MLKLFVPHARHIVHLQLATDEVLFDLQAQHDVERVRDLVGDNTYERVADSVGGEAELTRGGIGSEGERELLSQERQVVLEERLRERNVALPQQRLALVYPHTERQAHGQVGMVRVAGLLVQGVTCLVDGAAQRLVDEIGLAVRRRHPNIRAVDANAERVHAHVKAATSSIEAKVAGDLVAQCDLGRLVQGRLDEALAYAQVWFIRGDDEIPQRLKLLSKLGKEFI
mmetsp:Transcript_16063/g.27693  ORF Transcript_16063/g.27693 Transcript_16063/m.27693 type:complete len:226 (-) Transcript_16063:729-1406(-)